MSFLLQSHVWRVACGVGPLCLLLELGCGGGPAPEAVARFPVGPARVENVAIVQEYPAILSAVRYAELRSRVDGVVEAVHVDEGQRVQRGDPVFEISAGLLHQRLLVAQSQLARAEAELVAARLERDQARTLVEQAVVSPAELALAEARAEAASAARAEAQAGVGLARLEREQATVRAPFDGVINRLPRRAGSMVAAQELLTTVSDSGEIFAYFSLSEQEALEWASAANRPAEVTLRLADGGEHPQPGVVDALGAELDPDTRTLQLRARFPNADGLLRHGGTATVLVRRSAADAVLVPQRATRDVQGNVYVYVVGADQVPVPRRIVAARRVGEDYWVSDGLAAGENIVLDGIQKLREGQAIVTSPAEQET